DPSEPRTKRGINRIQDLPVGESVVFNQFGQAVGKWQYLYGKYIGTHTRRLISILKKNWKQVTKEQKNFLWSDIKAHFRLENDDVKKHTLVSCGTKWKAFMTKLRVKFILNKAPRNKNGIKTLPLELIDVSKNLVLYKQPESWHKILTNLKREYGVGCDIGYKKGIKGYVRKNRIYEQRKDIEEIEMKFCGHNGVPTKRVIPQHENAPFTKKGKGNETPKEPNKQDKALEETTKHQKTMQDIDEVKERVEKEKAANRKPLQDLEDEVPWSNERPLENKELNAIIGAWFTLWRD
nr:protein exportin 1A [Tanacetum cinerariifolium]